MTPKQVVHAIADKSERGPLLRWSLEIEEADISIGLFDQLNEWHEVFRVFDDGMYGLARGLKPEYGLQVAKGGHIKRSPDDKGNCR
jgi:hypothetical protein